MRVFILAHMGVPVEVEGGGQNRFGTEARGSPVAAFVQHASINFHYQR